MAVKTQLSDKMKKKPGKPTVRQRMSRTFASLEG